MSFDQFHPQQIPGGQPGPYPAAGYGYAPVPVHAGPYPVPRTDQKIGNTAEVVAAWIVTVLTLGYMLPWAVAATRGKSNSAAIALVDFFTGWTFIGWIAALVMACTSHQSVAAGVNVVVAQQFGAPHPQWGWAPQQNPNPPYPQG